MREIVQCPRCRKKAFADRCDVCSDQPRMVVLGWHWWLGPGNVLGREVKRWVVLAFQDGLDGYATERTWIGPMRQEDMVDGEWDPMPSAVPLEACLEIAGTLIYRAKYPTEAEITGAITLLEKCRATSDDPRTASAIEELRQLKPSVIVMKGRG